MSISKKYVIPAVFFSALVNGSAMALEAGDFIVRAGPTGVFPTGESDELNAIPGAKVEAQDAWSLGITLTYMLTNQIGVGVLGAWPFEHDIDPNNDLENATGSSSSVASTKHLPPTVTLQWHFPTTAGFRPFVGAGFNYTYFFDEDTDGAINAANIDIDDSFGLAGEIGVDYELQDNWLVSGQLWYVGISPDAKIKGAGLDEKIEVEIDPWIFMLGVGKKF